jgi:dCMP deaminase
MGVERPSWDTYFMNIARAVADRATCPRRRVGAVLVRERRILTTGFNGAPRGLPHCTEVGCDPEEGHCQRSVHAEQNAVIQAALHGVSTAGADLYCTSHPCAHCASVLVNAGVATVIYADDYPDARSRAVLRAAGVRAVRLGPGDGREEA